MNLLPDRQSCGLRMLRECQEHLSLNWLQRKPLDSNPIMHHGTWVTQVPWCVIYVLWCMSRSLTRGGRENVPDIPGACATHNFTYQVRGPWPEGYCNIARKSDESYPSRNPVWPELNSQLHNRFEMLRRARQLYHHTLCKTSQRFDNWHGYHEICFFFSGQWCQDKMAEIFQILFSNLLSCNSIRIHNKYHSLMNC